MFQKQICSSGNNFEVFLYMHELYTKNTCKHAKLCSLNVAITVTINALLITYTLFCTYRRKIQNSRFNTILYTSLYNISR